MDTEGRIVCVSLLSIVVFFCLAFVSNELKGDGSLAKFLEERRRRYIEMRLKKRDELLALVDDNTRATFFALESTWEQVYRRVFTKLEDVRPAFLSEEEAKSVEPWPRDSPRRAHCGGLGTILPKILTLGSGHGRCPPWKWVWALNFEQEKIPPKDNLYV